MSDLENTLHAFVQALDVKASRGEQLRLWLRDDDAVAPTVALDRLLDLTSNYSVPITLAVIPQYSGADLVESLRNKQHVTVAVHGWSHVNHALKSEKKQELGDHRDLVEVVGELQQGYTKLTAFYGQQFVPMLVPPWNRISDKVTDSLSDIGFTALSTFGREKPAPIPVLNTHVDIVFSKGGNGVRDNAQLFNEMTQHVQEGGDVIGLLTHHLVHQEPAWEFLEMLFTAVANHPAIRWCSASELSG